MGKNIITILEKETKGVKENGVQKTLNTKELTELSGLNRQTVTRSLRMSKKEMEFWNLRSKTKTFKYIGRNKENIHYITKKSEQAYWIDCNDITSLPGGKRMKISKFSQSMERKSVGEVPKTTTPRPIINYPDPSDRKESIPKEVVEKAIDDVWNEETTPNITMTGGACHIRKRLLKDKIKNKLGLK